MKELELKDPRKSKRFDKLKPDVQERLIRIYEHVKEYESKSEWEEYTISGKPFVQQGTKHVFMGMIGKGKKKFPRIRAFIPGKANEEKRIHKLLVKDCYERFGVRPVPDEKPLHNWSSVEMEIVFFMPRPKSQTSLQEVITDMNIGVPLTGADVDNLSKVFLDALKGFLFLDDATVFIGHLAKCYAEPGSKGYTVFRIREAKRVQPTHVKEKNIDELLA